MVVGYLALLELHLVHVLRLPESLFQSRFCLPQTSDLNLLSPCLLNTLSSTTLSLQQPSKGVLESYLHIDIREKIHILLPTVGPVYQLHF